MGKKYLFAIPKFSIKEMTGCGFNSYLSGKWDYQVKPVIKTQQKCQFFFSKEWFVIEI
jgi:hypothetical protein